jgi:hypothetical protein
MRFRKVSCIVGVIASGHPIFADFFVFVYFGAFYI